ncbi:4a-hydroxytetrahydrobiopterin dehydratase [Evansella caseinilytica]|uniref:4a-hydroxytetrahydrobiopterin dehydratase n=1 Tax=Evansella caseinilytica TaxID=1503961 RepID=A0A1H3GRK1_9BACI|nr:4a-hydroxytetrahydrobiopterin dehydratase [Evansella caseinilytica]SDY04959.1 4a-hydroxytetrahydrobiopterin dehydratase [Evansella caseinilytica]
MEKLSEQEVRSFLVQAVGWQLVEDKWIEKKYRFDDYLKGIDFVQNVARLAEEINHHPVITIDYKLIRIKLFSWDANGLTELDCQLAKQYDNMYEAP